MLLQNSLLPGQLIRRQAGYGSHLLNHDGRLPRHGGHLQDGKSSEHTCQWVFFFFKDVAHRQKRFLCKRRRGVITTPHRAHFYTRKHFLARGSRAWDGSARFVFVPSYNCHSSFSHVVSHAGHCWTTLRSMDKRTFWSMEVQKLKQDLALKRKGTKLRWEVVVVWKRSAASACFDKFRERNKRRCLWTSPLKRTINSLSKAVEFKDPDPASSVVSGHTASCRNDRFPVTVETSLSRDPKTPSCRDNKDGDNFIVRRCRSIF